MASDKPAYLCLLTHPDRPEVIKVGLTYKTIEQSLSEKISDGWEIHRYRFVEEPELAELLIWELLDRPRPEDGGPVETELGEAEDAFRGLVYRMDEEIALAEKAKELNA